MTKAQIDSMRYLLGTGYVRSMVYGTGDNHNCISVFFRPGYIEPGAFGRMTRTITPSGKVIE